jgi:hypothetical protein
LLNVFGWVFEPEAHIGVRGEVKDLFAAFHRRFQSLQVKIIASYELIIFMSRGILHEALLPRRKVIPAHDLVAFIEKMVGKVTSNEPRSPGDKIFHCRSAAASASWGFAEKLIPRGPRLRRYVEIEFH